MSRVASSTRVQKILKGLDQSYPDAHCELAYQSSLQLLVATILSAQCTDARVNIVTKDLFTKYKTAKDFAAAKLPELQRTIYSTGFYRHKAKNIKNACRILVNEFSGEVPSTMEDLVKLPGVARKTANVILGTAFHVAAGIVVDTHAQRVSQRLELSQHKDPNKVEQDLMRLVPPDRWITFSHQMVIHGRYTCTARAPKCRQCLLFDLCKAPVKNHA